MEWISVYKSIPEPYTPVFAMTSDERILILVRLYDEEEYRMIPDVPRLVWNALQWDPSLQADEDKWHVTDDYLQHHLSREFDFNVICWMPFPNRPKRIK
jgi:hypothetical protein